MKAIQPKIHRVALVGCGRFAEFAHVAALRDLRDRTAVAAVCDPSLERRTLLGSMLDLGADRQFADVRSLLETVTVDVVDVAASAPSHAEIALAACSAGKHVVCEMPLSGSLVDADRILEAADSAGVALGVIHNFRYRPPIRKALWRLAEGAIGVPFSIHIAMSEPHPSAGVARREPHWRHQDPPPGRGCWLEQGYHAIYLARELMGSDVQTLSALSGTFFHAVDVEDHAVALLRHRNGGITCVRTSWAIRDEASFAAEIACTGGTLRIGSWNSPLSISPVDRGISEDIECGHVNDVAEALRDFLDALDTRQSPPVCGDEARRNLRVVLAAYESAKEGRIVAVS